MCVHDLNSRRHFPGKNFRRWGCVRRADRLCAAHGVSSPARFQRLRRALPRRLSPAILLLPRSVSGAGLCAAHVSRKLARHRDVLGSGGLETVSRGLPQPGLAEHLGRRQPRSRLADLCRFRPGVDSPRPPLVRQRAARGGTEANGLCPRLDDDRSLFEPVPLGQVSPQKGSRQAAHAAAFRVSYIFPTEKCPLCWLSTCCRSSRAPST